MAGQLVASQTRALRPRVAVVAQAPPSMAAPPAVPAGLRAAIVTLWDGDASFACAVMHWCDHAQRLADVFRAHLGIRTDLVTVLTTSRGDDVVKSDCPQLQVVRPDAALLDAVKRFATIGCKKGSWAGGLVNMYKWLVFGLVQYQFIIYADIDVELLRPEQPASVVGERWRSTFHFAAPPSRKPRVLSDKDPESPFNGGLWTLAWPSRELYERGLGLMHRVRWNESDGFDHAGQPRDLNRNHPELHWRMSETRMLRSNTWDFSMGDCDQAFLFHALHLDSAVGADFEPVQSDAGADAGPMQRVGIGAQGRQMPGFVHTARHYYSHPKPWYWTQCMQKRHMTFTQKAGSPRFEDCPVIPRKRVLFLKNAGRVLWFLNHTDWQSRPATSKCASAFSLVLPELTRFGRKPPTRPPKYSGSLQRLR